MKVNVQSGRFTDEATLWPKVERWKRKAGLAREQEDQNEPTS